MQLEQLANRAKQRSPRRVVLEREGGPSARRGRRVAAGRTIIQGNGAGGSSRPRRAEPTRWGAPSQRQQRAHGYGKIADIGSGRYRTVFSREYLAGSLPFHIDHGCNQNKLVWDIPLQEVQYNPLLPTCFEGIVETEHPYVFLARAATTELLAADDASAKVLPLLPALIKPIRAALMQANKNLGIIEFCLQTLATLSNLVGEHMNAHLKYLVPQIHKISFAKKFDDQVTHTFQTFESNGGAPALNEIKRRVPTYTTINL